MMRQCEPQELQPLLHTRTTYARGLFGTLKPPDSFLIYYQLQQKSPTGTHSIQDMQLRYDKVLANTSRLNNFVILINSNDYNYCIC